MGETPTSGPAHRSGPAAPQPGVLSGTIIKAYVDADQLIFGSRDDNIRGARYDVHIARDGCRLPDGRYYEIGEGGFVGSLILESGDSAWISTRETFKLPDYLAGTVTLRNEYASRGLLLLSGVLIDPLYGTDANSPGDGRLHFFVANLGRESIDIRPNEDAVAAVQFFTVSGAPYNTKVPSAATSPETTLGFVESLKKVERSYDALRSSVAQTRDLMRNLIILGYFVLATAVISASLATILGISSNQSLVNDVRDAAPHTASGKGMVAAIALSLAWIVTALALAFGPRRTRTDPVEQGAESERQAAALGIRTRRTLQMAAGLIFLGVVLSFAVWILAKAGLSAWPVWVALFGSVAFVALMLVQHGTRPINPEQLDSATTQLFVRRRLQRHLVSDLSSATLAAHYRHLRVAKVDLFWLRSRDK